VRSTLKHLKFGNFPMIAEQFQFFFVRFYEY